MIEVGIIETNKYFHRKPVLFLDLDGTVRESASGKKFIKDVNDIKIRPYVLPTLHYYKKKGFAIVAITNQGSIAFGIKTNEDVIAELEKTDALCEGLFDSMHYCPTHEKGRYPYDIKSLDRKPHTGMISGAERVLLTQHFTQIDYGKSIFVGDRLEDEECAKRAGIQFIWEYNFFMATVKQESFERGF